MKRIVCVLTVVFALAGLMPRFAFAAGADAADEAPLEEMLGQMVMLGFRGTEFSPDSPIACDIREGRVGGVILFDRDLKLPGQARNIVSPEQTRRLVSDMQKAASGAPLFVGVDQEGGRVRRLRADLGFLEVPSARVMGRKAPADTRQIATRLGAELASLGINVDFAPVADVAVRRDSPAIDRLERAFSNDARLVAAHDEAFLEGLAEYGVIGCLKHFPGHGSAGADTHLGSADITASWQEAELYPYERLIKDGVVEMIMVGHLRHNGIDPRLPASLSPAFVRDMLRGRLGFEGVVVTDDLQMKAIRDHFSLEEVVSACLEADVDIMLFGNNLEYDPELAGRVAAIARRLVENGTVSRERIAASYNRIMRLKSRLGQPAAAERP